MELVYKGGFWFFMQNGREVANTGDDTVRLAQQKTGLKVNCVSVLDYDVVAAMLGAEALEAVARHKASLPAPRKRSKTAERSWHYRTLKGW